MRLFMFSVRDVCVDVSNPPYCAQSIGGGIRMFSDAVTGAGEDNMLRKHPEHFELFHVGFFDDVSGKLECIEKVQVAIATEFVKSDLREVSRAS